MAANKFLALDLSTGNPKQKDALDVSAGVGSAGSIVALDSTGRIDSTMMPTGIGASTISVTASEALAAGDFVNFWNNTGTKAVRKANATDVTKPAHGFVLASVASSALATVYTDGQNTKVAPGSYTVANVGNQAFLSTTAGGMTVNVSGYVTGNIVQPIGDVLDVSTYITVDFRVGQVIIV